MRPMVDHHGGAGPFREKIDKFQEVTGVRDSVLAMQTLSANSWDVNRAVSSFFENPANASTADATVASAPGDLASASRARPPAPPLSWKLITFPFFVISSSVGLFSAALGLGVRVAGGVISHSLGLLGLRTPPVQDQAVAPFPAASADASPVPTVSADAAPVHSASADAAPVHSASADAAPVPSASTDAATVPSASAEAAEFVDAFNREFGASTAVRPSFVAEGFDAALLRSHSEERLLYVYLHYPDDLANPANPANQDVTEFCIRSLCEESVVNVLKHKFVCWGGNILRDEGSKMKGILRASSFPFCAILKPVQGPPLTHVTVGKIDQWVSNRDMFKFVRNTADAEEATNILLKEEFDAANRAALEANQAREHQRKDEKERLEREAVEAQKRAAHESAEKKAALARRRQEKAMSLGDEPEKGSDVAEVLVLFPDGGERRRRRFHNSATIKSLYDWVDSLDGSTTEKYHFISNFPTVTYGPEKHSLTLKEAGLVPQAKLFMKMD